MKIFISLVGCIFFLAVSAMSLGQSISYNFTGEITQIDANQNNVVPNLDIGDSFTGNLLIESPELNNTTRADFNPPSSTVDFSMEINGVDLLLDLPPVGGRVDLSGTYSFILNGMSQEGTVPLPTTTISVSSFVFWVVDFDRSSGITELLPNSFDLSEFEAKFFEFEGIHIPTGNVVELTGELTTLISVPEPSGVGIIAIGLLLFANKRRKQKTA